VDDCALLALGPDAFTLEREGARGSGWETPMFLIAESLVSIASVGGAPGAADGIYWDGAFCAIFNGTTKTGCVLVWTLIPFVFVAFVAFVCRCCCWAGGSSRLS
jgi:hypothetical protein